MNCKPGDLAIVIRSRAGNEGRIFTCIRLATVAEIESHLLFSYMSQPCWITDGEFNAKAARGDQVFHRAIDIVPDACARPIRDPGEDARDEMLRPLPNQLEPA